MYLYNASVMVNFYKKYIQYNLLSETDPWFIYLLVYKPGYLATLGTQAWLDNTVKIMKIGLAIFMKVQKKIAFSHALIINKEFGCFVKGLREKQYFNILYQVNYSTVESCKSLFDPMKFFAQ